LLRFVVLRSLYIITSSSLSAGARPTSILAWCNGNTTRQEEYIAQLGVRLALQAFPRFRATGDHSGPWSFSFVVFKNDHGSILSIPADREK
jgi:hypothetical protein